MQSMKIDEVTKLNIVKIDTTVYKIQCSRTYFILIFKSKKIDIKDL